MFVMAVCEWMSSLIFSLLYFQALLGFWRLIIMIFFVYYTVLNNNIYTKNKRKKKIYCILRHKDASCGHFFFIFFCDPFNLLDGATMCRWYQLLYRWCHTLRLCQLYFLLVFFKSKREHLRKKEIRFLFHFENFFCSWDNKVLTCQVFKCHDASNA